MVPVKKPSTDAVIQTLKWVRKQGFRPVPLRKCSKAAVDEKYVDPNYNPPPDEFWLNNDFGIGVVTGPKHGGPVDVDLDCNEAVYFAGRFLPATGAVFGRPGKPKSHFIYRINEDEARKKAFVDPIAKSTIIELRGDGGHQTVFPGSLHEETGQLISWEDKTFPEVPRISVETIERAVRKIAIATLVTRYFWAEGQRNEITKHLTGMMYYMEWSEEETASLIEGVMDYTGDDDRTRLRTVAATYRKGERGEKITGAKTLREFVGEPAAVDKIIEWSGSEYAQIIQDFNERFAVVSIKGKFRIAETDVMERGGVPVLFAKEDFLNMTATDTVMLDEKRVAKAKVWLASPRRRSYRSMDFVPGVEDCGPVLNLWTGWAVDAKPEGSCQAWLDLLHSVICGNNEELYNWMLMWFANIVCEPLEKPLTAPVVIGRQGAGKSLLFGYFGRILGSAYTTITHESHIYGQFNKHLATTLLLHSEEALYGGDRKHRGIIKSLITDEFRIFEPKGIDAERVKNYLRLALTSNEAWAAPTETDDRRFTVIDMEDRKITDKHVKAVLHEMNGSGPSTLFHYLRHEFKYDPEVVRVNIKNESLGVMKILNFEPITAWWYETLKSGCILPDYLAWATSPAGAEWPQVVSSAALYTSMWLKMREHNQRYVPVGTAFAVHLNKMTGTKLDRKQKYYTNPVGDEAPREVRLLPSKQYTIMNMPTLDKCRLAFERYVSQPLEWPEEPDPEDKPAYLKI